MIVEFESGDGQQPPAHIARTLELLDRLQRVGRLLPTGNEQQRLFNLASTLDQAGQVLHVGAHVLRDDAAQGTRVVVQIAAELVGAATQLHSSGELYAGTALVRQMLEVQYLLAAFGRDRQSAASWIRSTRSQREGNFRPSKLRDTGGFRRDDYRHHCDITGHPTPLGRVVLRSSSDRERSLALAWRDLAQHALDLTYQVLQASSAVGALELVGPTVDAAARPVAAWLEHDQLLVASINRDLATGPPGDDQDAAATPSR